MERFSVKTRITEDSDTDLKRQVTIRIQGIEHVAFHIPFNQLQKQQQNPQHYPSCKPKGKAGFMPALPISAEAGGSVPPRKGAS